MMLIRTQTLIQLAQNALAEAQLPQRSDKQAGRLLGVALWYLCEAVDTDSNAVLTPHRLMKGTENDHEKK